MDKQQKQQQKTTNPMTQEASRRMQSAFDKNQSNQDAKSRIQSTADKRANQEASKDQSSQRQ